MSIFPLASVLKNQLFPSRPHSRLGCEGKVTLGGGEGWSAPWMRCRDDLRRRNRILFLADDADRGEPLSISPRPSQIGRRRIGTTGEGD